MRVGIIHSCLHLLGYPTEFPECQLCWASRARRYNEKDTIISFWISHLGGKVSYQGLDSRHYLDNCRDKNCPITSLWRKDLGGSERL